MLIFSWRGRWCPIQFGCRLPRGGRWRTCEIGLLISIEMKVGVRYKVTQTFTETKSLYLFAGGRRIPPGVCRLPINERHLHLRDIMVVNSPQFRSQWRSNRADMWVKLCFSAFTWGFLARCHGCSCAVDTGRLPARCILYIHCATGHRCEPVVLPRCTTVALATSLVIPPALRQRDHLG